MKNFLRPLGLALAFMMLTAGAYAVASGDSVVSLSYLQSTFFPKAVQAGEEAGNQALQKTYDSAKAQLDAVHGGVGEGGTGPSSDTLQRRTWTDGQIISLSTGAGFLMLDGSATVVHTGAVIDVTAGTEVSSGSALAQNHRYVVGENTDAAVTIRSGEAALGVQVDPQDAGAPLAQAIHQGAGRGGLAHAALLVGDGNDNGQKISPCLQTPAPARRGGSSKIFL